MKNKYFCYTSSCVIETNILLYIFLYNDNKYFCYTSPRIIETNIFIIHRLV